MYALLFIIVLLVTFAVLLLVTRPTKTEQSVATRLENIGRHTDLAAPTAAGPEDILKSDKLSDVPWLDLILKRLELSQRLQELISQSGSDWTVGRVLAGAGVLAVGVAWFTGFWVQNIVFRLVLGAMAAAAPFFYLTYKRSIRFSKFNALLPDALDLMSRALKAGHSIVSAVEMVGNEISAPLGPEFRRTFEEQNFGLPLREAMLSLGHRVPIPDLQFVLTAILVQKETGGNLIEVMDKAAAVLRDRMRLQGQIRIYTAQGRLTGWILCGLPFILFLLMNFLNPGYARILLDDPFGQKLAIAGIVLMAIGVWVMRRIIEIKV
jgi:tight adherence protein B